MISRSRSILVLCTSILTFSVCSFVRLSADEDEDDKLVQSDSPAMNASDSVQHASNHDSLFAEINRGYLTLEPIFQRSCFDCHSDKTKYPWYYKLPVIKGMIDDDVREARERLDVSNGFPFEGRGGPADQLKDIKEEVMEGAMPLRMYRLMHWSAGLSQSEKDSIGAWVDRSMVSLADHGIVPRKRKGQDSTEVDK